MRSLPLPHVHDSRPEFDVLVMYACEFHWMKLGSRECSHRDRHVGWTGDRPPRLSYRAPRNSAAEMERRHGAHLPLARTHRHRTVSLEGLYIVEPLEGRERDILRHDIFADAHEPLPHLVGSRIFNDQHLGTSRAFDPLPVFALILRY